jgi:hypothetical protein
MMCGRVGRASGKKVGVKVALLRNSPPSRVQKSERSKGVGVGQKYNPRGCN